MKPYGRRMPIHDKIDFHPDKYHVNWWEAELDIVDKKVERRRAKKEIQQEIDEMIKEID